MPVKSKERGREYDRRKYLRIKADPERWRRYQDKNREWYLKNKWRYKEYRKQRRDYGLLKEVFILNYLIHNPNTLGYEIILLKETKDFDLIGVKKDGSAERVEVEVYASCFLRHNHDPNICERVVALFNTDKPLPVPVTIINREEYFKFATKFKDLLQ